MVKIIAKFENLASKQIMGVVYMLSAALGFSIMALMANLVMKYGGWSMA